MRFSRDTRPGGRSARVKAAVFAAVEALLDETPGEMPTMAAIAGRAELNPTTLKAHQSGLRPNFAAPPLPLLTVTLDTPAKKGALRLDLWPGPKRPGWSHSVIMHGADGNPVGTQTLSTEDLNALLHILERSN